ncbi:YhcH/YjgK/YiaL family protein [uncultured Veillonella sp.]|uniref:YhcH/YjgK/YiaL family protein n=1 Tax=uncultured Veillonella sp. TaxID=159268 RepID=UPI002626B67F|nr:YhcH/YjgK/YiaL family protein [uncultured Veillonella sp.]
MIFGHIDVPYDTHAYAPALVKVLDWLKHTDLLALPAGRQIIEGEAIYANVDDVKTRQYEDTKPESHKRYIDIQFMVQGAEKIGFTPNVGPMPPSEVYEDRDLYFYNPSLADAGIILAKPGNYSIFFPDDLHRPLIAVDNTPQPIRKVVVKVSVDLLK